MAVCSSRSGMKVLTTPAGSGGGSGEWRAHELDEEYEFDLETSKSWHRLSFVRLVLTDRAGRKDVFPERGTEVLDPCRQTIAAKE